MYLVISTAEQTTWAEIGNHYLSCNYTNSIQPEQKLDNSCYLWFTELLTSREKRLDVGNM